MFCENVKQTFNEERGRSSDDDLTSVDLDLNGQSLLLHPVDDDPQLLLQFDLQVPVVDGHALCARRERADHRRRVIQGLKTETGKSKCLKPGECTRSHLADRSGAGHVLDLDAVVGRSEEVVATLTHKVVSLAVKGRVVRVTHNGASSAADLFGALPV